MKFKLNNHRSNLIYEQLNAKSALIESEFNSAIAQFKQYVLIQESLVSSVLSLFLEPKAKKQAEAMKDSPEYKELVKQIELSTKTLNALTDKLKEKVSEYNKNLASMKDAGIDVKNGMTPKQMMREFEKWQNKQNKAVEKLKPKIISPEFAKFLK